jgi:hypothetical protein
MDMQISQKRGHGSESPVRHLRMKDVPTHEAQWSETLPQHAFNPAGGQGAEAVFWRGWIGVREKEEGRRFKVKG